MKKDRWTESEVLSLPAEEHDYFERKSGALVKDDKPFRERIAKALSALANSQGGQLILGVLDNGTFDGVAKVLKGRQPTREWLEQVIPNLLNYPLQDFRVHEVEPDASSLIPKDRVIIVIDVGDSPLAPHQDIFTKLYYHRVGGHSVAAPHNYLDLLRRRETYPSQKIAHAWLNFVIRLFLDQLQIEEDRLNSMTMGWSYRTKTLSAVNHFYLSAGRVSLNQIQFLETYPDVETDFSRHDSAINDLVSEVSHLSTLIEHSQDFYQLYCESISPNSLQGPRLIYGRSLEVGDDNEILDKLFGDMSETERLGVLAQHVINNTFELARDIRVAPLWNSSRDLFMRVLNEAEIAKQNRVVFERLTSLLKIVKQLVSRIKTIRRELATKFGEVYEDETLNRGGLSMSPVQWNL